MHYKKVAKDLVEGHFTIITRGWSIDRVPGTNEIIESVLYPAYLEAAIDCALLSINKLLEELSVIDCRGESNIEETVTYWEKIKEEVINLKS